MLLDGRTDRETDIYDEVNSRFSQFCRRAWYGIEYKKLYLPALKFTIISNQPTPGSAVWDSAVGIATRYRLYGPAIPRCGRDFPHPSRPALGSSQPTAKWVPSLFPGVKRPGSGVGHPPHPAPKLKKEYPTSGLSWPVLGWTLPLNSREKIFKTFLALRRTWRFIAVFTTAPSFPYHHTHAFSPHSSQSISFKYIWIPSSHLRLVLTLDTFVPVSQSKP